MKGKVWLVGAGPGSLDLLTIKGKEVIENAEVIVYDRLVGQEILALIPDHIEMVDVGKQANYHKIPQNSINEILLHQAKKGKRVVRLKGGDPFLFGRGGEELKLLAKHEIPFEVVPGITSAIAVPAYNGIPVTHRDTASSLHIITGHKKENEPYDMDFKSLVNIGGTLVFLMGLSAVTDICHGLIEGGMDINTPAAILQQGTTARQKKLIATVATLTYEMKKTIIEAPAILVIGNVCNYGKEFDWFHKLPLFGHKIIVTRPKERISTVAEKLRKLGAQVLELPSIKTVEVLDTKEFEKQIKKLSEYDYIAFTSPAGVKYFFHTLKKLLLDIRTMSGIKIAAIGPGTKKEIEDMGIFVDIMPEKYDGQEFGKLLARVLTDGESVLIPRAKNGNPELIDEINKNKTVNITEIPIYETLYETNELIDQKEEILKGNISMTVFTSASTVRGFYEVTKGIDYDMVTAVCIGKQTKKQADAYFKNTVMAKEATIESLIEKVVETANYKKG